MAIAAHGNPICENIFEPYFWFELKKQKTLITSVINKNFERQFKQLQSNISCKIETPKLRLNIFADMWLSIS